MHILILASFYPSPVRPHTGIFFQQQAEALHRAGHRVGVLVLPRIRETLYTWRQHKPLPPAITREDVDFPVYRMHYGWFPRVFPYVCAFLTRHYGVPAYRQYVNEQGPVDIIHAHNTFYAGVLAARVHAESHTPFIITEHSSNHLRGRVFLPGQHALMHRAFAQAGGRYAVSQRLATALQRYHPDVGVIDNIVSIDFFTMTPPPPEPFVFAALGSLVAIKHFDLLIRAFADAFRGQSVLLKIGGGGPDYRVLEKLIQTLGMQSQIELTGQLTREGVRGLYQNSHAVVSSSRIETFGVTLIEAMACGRPVIATRSGGPEGIITPETGILVHNDDEAELVRGLRDMRDNYARYDGAQIRAYCQDRFGEAAVVAKLEAIYRSVR